MAEKNIVGKRKCMDCGKTKPKSEFYLKKLRSGKGKILESRCKECSMEVARRWRMDKPEEYREYYRLRMRKVRAERRKKK